MKLSRFAAASAGVFISLLATVFALRLFADPRHIDPHSFLEHIRYLASDELEGRGDGSPGLEKAADYIGKSFAATGLEPAGDNGTFFQRFELVAGLSMLPDLGTLPSAAASFIFRCSLGRHYPPIGTRGTPRLPPCAITSAATASGIVWPVIIFPNA